MQKTFFLIFDGFYKFDDPNDLVFHYFVDYPMVHRLKEKTKIFTHQLMFKSKKCYFAVFHFYQKFLING
jgi:hypothetical protein